MSGIDKVCVIGAGVMGAGIAAHVANAGVPVVLLDIAPSGAQDRDAIAKGAIGKLLGADPAPFMHPRNAKLITPGNTEDHMDLLGQCDWIVEAVIENLEIKSALYARIDEHRKPGAIVSSNTSTLPLSKLTEGMADGLAKDFLITHFFNPPRYMALLEIVTGDKTRQEVTDAVSDFADRMLGKGVIKAKDRPGFIANRIGAYWLQCAVIEAMDGGLCVEEADAAIGRPLGIPKTGVFGLLDLVGLDLMPHVLASLGEALPDSDDFHQVRREPELFKKMIAEGYTGRKGKGGFYRLNTASGERIKEAIDLKTGNYRTAFKPKFSSIKKARKKGLRALFEHGDKASAYARTVMFKTLAYAAAVAPEISENIAALDQAMRLGYNWKRGPFQMIDEVGASWLGQNLKKDGVAVPELLSRVGDGSFYRIKNGREQYFTFAGDYADVPRPPGAITLTDIKRVRKPFAKNGSASLWDIGDGVACLEFHSKMNAIGPGTLKMIETAVRTLTHRGFKALVIHNEGTNFSVGANLGLVLVVAMFRAWFIIDWFIEKGQKAYMGLKFAPFPVVGAPSGMALGGGCEILLHCDAVQAHAETYMGLVEAGVGIVPAWGGCKELLMRWSRDKKRPGGPMPPVIKTFETIGLAKVAKSAEEARDLMFIGPKDAITMNRDRLLSDAKAKALELAEGYSPPQIQEISLPGPTARAAIEMAVESFRTSGKATAHDVVVSGQLAHVLSGGETDITETLGEDDILALEREAIGKLARHPQTLARMRHMLKTGKPLRN